MGYASNGSCGARFWMWKGTVGQRLCAARVTGLVMDLLTGDYRARSWTHGEQHEMIETFDQSNRPEETAKRNLKFQSVDMNTRSTRIP